MYYIKWVIQNYHLHKVQILIVSTSLEIYWKLLTFCVLIVRENAKKPLANIGLMMKIRMVKEVKKTILYMFYLEADIMK